MLRELQRQLPAEPLIYLGDTARVPYGTKSSQTVLRYARQAADFLAAQRIKLLVVACNTASAVALEALTAGFQMPVLGVIEPGVRGALQATRNGRVGVIGTEGTIRSQAYERALLAKDPAVTVQSVPCPLFVPLAEEGWIDHAATKMIAAEYLEPLLRQGIDTLVLGCTHYPLLKQVLQEIVGSRVSLIDSAEETAKEVADRLARNGLQRTAGTAVAPQYFVTDIPERFRRVGGAFLGAPLEGVSTIVLD